MVDGAILERVGEYRKAARMAVEADRDFATRALALLDLADAARAEPDALTARWSELAIWAEAEAFLVGLERKKDAQTGDAWERAQRRMRAEGYETCPRCRSRIASEKELEAMHLRRLSRIDELERRERAIEP
jgi:hypothetical protein